MDSGKSFCWVKNGDYVHEKSIFGKKGKILMYGFIQGSIAAIKMKKKNKTKMMEILMK